MPRKTVIFGNGLGMALDSAYFSLDRALGHVWDGAVLDDPAKNLICQCLRGEDADRPHGEAELDILHYALSACDFLNAVGGGEFHWLSAEGQNFPVAVRRLFYETAVQFHQYEGALPAPFCDSLSHFLRTTRSHIATLNYDNLIYQPLIERGVLAGYDGALVDGFHRDGFGVEHMERWFGNNFGYYMHLHGSPLFVNRGRAIVKIRQRELVPETDTVSSHIVLSHVRHKPIIIGASPLLTAYWQYLLQAIGESTEVIMVGYSGLDNHLNDVLRRSAAGVAIRVVEWVGAGQDREAFWTQQLGRAVTVVPQESILDFAEWDAAPARV
jgi:hypothetical protein